MKSAVELPSCCVSRHNSPRFEYSLLDRYLLTFPARSLTGLDLEPGACYFVPRLGIPRAQTQVDISRDNSQSGLDLEMFSFLLSNLEISSSERLKICPARIHEWRNDRSPLSLWPSTRTARAGIASTSRALHPPDLLLQPPWYTHREWDRAVRETSIMLPPAHVRPTRPLLEMPRLGVEQPNPRCCPIREDGWSGFP
jgi:hypothetical protein